MNMSEGQVLGNWVGGEGGRTQPSFEKDTQKLASDKESNCKRGARVSQYHMFCDMMGIVYRRRPGSPLSEYV